MSTDGVVDSATGTGAPPEVRIGARLKQRRQHLGLSLRALADRTGFSASFLSQLELDQTSPSLASLAKLSHALGVGLGQLLAEAGTDPATAVVRATDRARLRSDWSHAQVSSLLPSGADQRLSIVMIELEPGGRTGDPGTVLAGREFAFCVRGSVSLRLGEQELRLGEGDSVFYEAAAGPRWTATGRGRAELLLVGIRIL